MVGLGVPTALHGMLTLPPTSLMYSSSGLFTNSGGSLMTTWKPKLVLDQDRIFPFIRDPFNPLAFAFEIGSLLYMCTRVHCSVVCEIDGASYSRENTVILL